MNKHAFSSLKLKTALIETLNSLSYHNMTPIQAQSLPEILEGRDVIAKAKTGSGKTIAFGLGLLQHLDAKQFQVQALVLCPTRELADQVANVIRKLARGIHNIKVLTLCGGLSFGAQVNSLAHGAHIIVGTPGRIEEHLRKQKLTLDQIKSLVFDEADRMLDMGFQESINAIMGYVPQKRQTCLFSATYPVEIEQMAARIMYKPLLIESDDTTEHEDIQQFFYRVKDDQGRLMAISRLLLHYQPVSTVIFCNTKRQTLAIADALRQQGISALALNGDLEQKQRDQILVRFSNKSVSVLVATDVAARGLDIDALDTVINAELPRDLDVHTHRIGRTGRAGQSGIAHTLITEKENHKLQRLAEHLEIDIALTSLPHVEPNCIPPSPPMATLQIDGGKKQKVRPGDIVGALTANKQINATQIGTITVTDFSAYIAVEKNICSAALKTLEQGKIKGRSFRVRHIRG